MGQINIKDLTKEELEHLREMRYTRTKRDLKALIDNYKWAKDNSDDKFTFTLSDNTEVEVSIEYKEDK